MAAEEVSLSGRRYRLSMLEECRWSWWDTSARNVWRKKIVVACSGADMGRWVFRYLLLFLRNDRRVVEGTILWISSLRKRTDGLTKQPVCLVSYYADCYSFHILQACWPILQECWYSCSPDAVSKEDFSCKYVWVPIPDTMECRWHSFKPCFQWYSQLLSHGICLRMDIEGKFWGKYGRDLASVRQQLLRRCWRWWQNSYKKSVNPDSPVEYGYSGGVLSKSSSHRFTWFNHLGYFGRKGWVINFDFPVTDNTFNMTLQFMLVL